GWHRPPASSAGTRHGMVDSVPTMPLPLTRLRSVEPARSHSRGREDIMNRTVLTLALTVLSLTTSTVVWGEDGGRAVKGGATTTAERGGPGTTFVLTISGFTFNETILEGQVSF